jgi:UBX domain-containing protein 1
MDPTVLQQFRELTHTNEQVANFYLESANGDLDTAVANYFSFVGAPNSSSSAKEEKKTGMARMTDVNQDKKKDDPNSNRYYAGGSTSSGNLILGRDDVNNDVNDLTAQIFKKAQESGAQNMSAEKSAEKEKFSGSGNRLGSEASSQQQQQQQSIVNGAEEEKTVTITFYQDGFTIDDGELRRFDDPNNKKFLEAINNGYVPREVAGMAKEVLVNLVDKKSEPYAPQKQSFQAFKGDGRSLSSRSSTASTSTPVNQPVSAPSYSVDSNRPHTNIQIRLHDGTRLNATFNLDDTVKTLMQFVQAARPNVGQFQLQTSFPRKILTDATQTIEQAGLKGAVILQSLI